MSNHPLNIGCRTKGCRSLASHRGENSKQHIYRCTSGHLSLIAKAPSPNPRPAARAKDPGAASRAARDEGMRKVSANSPGFVDHVRIVMKGVEPGREMTGEDIREVCEAADVIPNHHNAWGAATRGLLKDGTIIKTGRQTHSVQRRQTSRQGDAHLSRRWPHTLTSTLSPCHYDYHG